MVTLTTDRRGEPMKVAVLSDIHANFTALEAVLADLTAWQPDLVVVAGDIVNRGPEPKRCLELIRHRGQDPSWHILIGNHEEYVLYHDTPNAARSGPWFEIFRNSYWTYTRLSEADRWYLGRLPFAVTLTAPDGSLVYVTHASPGGTRDGLYPEMSSRVIGRKLPQNAAVLVVGHTHRAFVREVNGCLVVNAGAVGLPFDRDPRAAYARLEWRDGRWRAAVVRVPYDRRQTFRAFFTSGYIDGAGPLAWLVLAELCFARSQLYQWTCRYQKAVLGGALSMEEAVDRFLQEEGFTRHALQRMEV